MLGHLGRITADESGRPSPGHHLSQSSAAGLDAQGVQRAGNLRRAYRLGNRKPKYGNDGGVADLAQQLRPECFQRSREGLAVVRLGKVRHLQPLGALADASHQHFLFAAHQRVKLALRNARPRGDFKRARRSKAAFHERREGRLNDALASRRFVGAWLALFRRCLRRHDSP